MKTIDMDYIETPISPPNPSPSTGIDESLLSDKLNTFLNSKKTQPFSKFLARIKRRYY